MADLMTKLKTLSRDPRVRDLIEKARREAAKPDNRHRVEQLRSRVTKRR
ncbi:MAG TPA: hypothetical protein VI248_26405 [Kineosporiaceae bacterium]